MAFGPQALAKIDEIATACARHGETSIVALSGVAGTGKTLLGLAAAQKHTRHPLFVKQIQFHQSYSYEDFIEGLRPNSAGGFEPRAGLFLQWNDAASMDPSNSYVLLIEEFTRANIQSVIGELMTYLEHRDRIFETPISGRRIKVAKNLTILATLNPRDRTAVELDDALLRRLRILDCPPSTEQLTEMLETSIVGGPSSPAYQAIQTRLVRLFDECRRRHPETFDHQMPFGHGMFAGITSEADLRDLWKERIRYLLVRPHTPPHPFYKDIAELYPWRE